MQRPAPIVSLTLRFTGHAPFRPPATAVAHKEDERRLSAPPRAHPRELTVKWTPILELRKMAKPKNRDHRSRNDRSSLEPEPRINSQFWTYNLQNDRSPLEPNPIIREYLAYSRLDRRMAQDKNVESFFSSSRTTQATPTEEIVRRYCFRSSSLRYTQADIENHPNLDEWWKAHLTLSASRTETN